MTTTTETAPYSSSAVRNETAAALIMWLLDELLECRALGPYWFPISQWDLTAEGLLRGGTVDPDVVRAFAALLRAWECRHV